MRRLTRFAAIALILFFASIAPAGAQAPAGTTINACVNSAGLVRIVPPRTACLGSEQPIQWNITGPPGPQGPPGESDVEQKIHVFCGTGTVADALAQGANKGARLTVVIHGTCTESITVDRDDVTLRGAAAEDGLAAPDASAHVVYVPGAQRVKLQHMTITGGSRGIMLALGGSIEGYQLRVTGADWGVAAAEGQARLWNSMIEGCGSRNVAVGTNGHVTIWSSTVRDSGLFGIEAFGGTAELVDVTVEGNASSGLGLVAARVVMIDSRVRNNGTGMWLHGGTVQIGHSVVSNNTGEGIALAAASAGIDGNTRIENNGRDGIQAMTGSRVLLGGWTSIRNNGADGIRLKDTSVVGGFNVQGTQITANARWGIYCDPAPAVAQIGPHFDVGFILNLTHVFGNVIGQIRCPGFD